MTGQIHSGSAMDPYEFTVFHLFSGLGGGALGFAGARGRHGSVYGRFRTLGGVDVDSDACADFRMLTGVTSTVLDLFTRSDYADFHGHEPPADWHEATAEDLRAAASHQRPDVVFTSPPCKGISALLPTAQAESPKYRALNRLTVRGIRLALEAWADDPPSLIIFENVPRITSVRGAELLAETKATLSGAGYVVADGTHDMGAVGGLSQHRVRYLLVARRPDRCPPVLFQPPLREVRSIGEAIGPLPLPDDPAAGVMHRLPRLQWLTWVRLALIRAGHDWRDLQCPEVGRYRIVPSGCAPFNHIHRVSDFGAPAGAVTSSRDQAVSDPRLGYEPRRGACRVTRWDETATTVTGSASPSGGNMPCSAADPRIPHRPTRRAGDLHVGAWEGPANTVTGEDSVGSGAPSVGDPRGGPYGVVAWDGPAGTVTGNMRPSCGTTPANVADPRLGCSPRSGAYGVTAWEEPCGAVTASVDVHTQGVGAVADPRLPSDNDGGAWIIIAEDGTWHRPLTTLELAALQGLPTLLEDGRPLVLAGGSQAKWRERIGNAVPVPAARAIAEQMLSTLIQAEMGVRFSLNFSGTPIWVRPGVDREIMRQDAVLAVGP